MTRLFRALLLSAALTVTAASAAAQDAQAPADQSIIVTGKKITKQEIKDFVRDLTPVSSSIQISRFEHSVCPAAFGLPQAQSQAIANRMRRVAKSIGLAVGGDHCAPNVIVIVTSDKRTLIEQLARQRPDYFGDLPNRRIAELGRQPGPAAAWQLAGPEVNADGMEINSDLNDAAPINRTVAPSSRLTVAARPQFDAAVVVVERAALAGLTTTQLADYAAMRAYAGADPTRIRDPGAPTILRILDAPMGSAVPVTMTSWDFAFLNGLYASRRDITTAAQRSAIGKTMTDGLAAPPKN